MREYQNLPTSPTPCRTIIRQFARLFFLWDGFVWIMFTMFTMFTLFQGNFCRHHQSGMELGTWPPIIIKHHEDAVACLVCRKGEFPALRLPCLKAQFWAVRLIWHENAILRHQNLQSHRRNKKVGSLGDWLKGLGRRFWGSESGMQKPRRLAGLGIVIISFA